MTGAGGTGRWLPLRPAGHRHRSNPGPAAHHRAGRSRPGRWVHLLHTMGDTFTLTDDLTTRSPRSALIVGAGYIGLEMAEARRTRGLAVTVVERLPQVLPTLDPELGALVATELA